MFILPVWLSAFAGVKASISKPMYFFLERHHPRGDARRLWLAANPPPRNQLARLRGSGSRGVSEVFQEGNRSIKPHCR